MAKTKRTKRALLMSALSLLLCVSMLIGTTYAWFTDTAVSAGNKIVAGTLKIDLELLDKESGEFVSVKEEKTPIFDYELWEPGYTEVKVLRIVNMGSLALKWKAKFISETALTELAEVIDVYVCPSESELGYPADRNLADYTYAGTVANFVNTIEETTNGSLLPNKAAYLGIALKMQESAGNHYQGMSLGGAFDIQILATQLTSEEDSFDDQYDVEASLDFAPVSNINELKAALARKEENIVLTADCETTEALNVVGDANIDGAGFTVSRADGYTGTLFNVAAGVTLALENIILDGGAEWSSRSATPSNGENAGVVATGSLIATTGNGNIVLNEDTILQNNDGSSAVSLATRGGGTLTLNGAQIINNRAEGGGAIWGGGNIVINEGSKINGNHATSIGGAIRMVDGYNNIVFTMNGGEMNNNTSANTGGAIWGGNRATYIFNGGEMAYNSAVAGGAIWTGTYENYTFAGDFELHHNSSTDLGGAVRFCDHASLTMTGGKVYNNTVNGNSSAFYLNNNSASITGGEIADNFSYAGGLGLTMGMVDMDGVIAFDLSTNHNTAYLAKEFNAFEFTVNETAANFGEFNFKPADGYVYAEGDEAKLVCKNEGYATYWDEATGRFRLQTSRI